MTSPSAKTYVPFHFLWASVWPMFAVSVAGSILLGRNAGLGGIGSLLAGTAVAARMASRPAVTTRDAFQRAFPAVLVVYALLILLLGFGLTARGLQLRGMSAPAANAMAVVLLVGEATLWAVVLAGATSPVLARRARRLQSSAAVTPQA